MERPTKNSMTIDVEDYFHVSAFANHIDPKDWPAMDCRVERNTDTLLALFDQHDATATFFTLGWVAKRYPELIRRISDSGHEVASHGMEHQRASAQTVAEFRLDISESKQLLEDITGKPILGYRAPSFSFTKQNEWVYPLLLEEGYRYSSSVYPIKHDHYGIPDAPRHQYSPIDGLDEIPLSTIDILGKNLPISGGGYFRFYPYWVSRWAIQRFTRTMASPYIFYLHPWEVDPDQPRISDIGFKTRFRHYINLDKVVDRLSALLREFEWSSMANLYGYTKN